MSSSYHSKVRSTQKQGSHFDGTSDGTSEKLRRILKSHKTRSTFYTESTLRKLLCKRRIEWLQNIKTISFMKSSVVTVKQSTSMNLSGLLKSRLDEHKRSVRNSLMFGIWTLVLFL